MMPVAAQAYPTGSQQLVVAQDAETGEILFARDFRNPNASFEDIATREAHIASVTKCMALYCIADWVKEQLIDYAASDAKPADPLPKELQPFAAILAQQIPLTSRAARAGGISFLKNFQQNSYKVPSLSLDEALRISMLASTNDLIEAMNDAMGGKLVDRMNAKAQELGMTNTRFFTASGMPALAGMRNNYSSAVDLFKLEGALEANHPQFLGYLEQTSYRPERAVLRNSISRLFTVMKTKRVKVRRRRYKTVSYKVATYRKTDTFDTQAQYVDGDATESNPSLPEQEYASIPEGQGDADEIPVENTTEPSYTILGKTPSADTQSGLLRDCIRAKSGYTSAAQRSLLAVFQRPVNGSPRRVNVFLTGATRQVDRLAWARMARDNAFDRLATTPVRPPVQSINNSTVSLPAALVPVPTL